MKFRNEVTIDAKRETVWRAFNDLALRGRWQAELTGFRAVSGRPGEIGAVIELTYDDGGRELKVSETTTELRAPDFAATLRESGRGTTLIVNTFEAIGEDRTRWSAWGNARFDGLKKWFSQGLLKGARKRLEDDMQRFKLFVETERASASR